MAFLFKSKKNQQASGLPPATRNIHTSEGAPSGSGAVVNGPKDGAVISQTPTPSSSYNNSLNSVNSTSSPDQQRPRQRAESESQVGSRISSLWMPLPGSLGKSAFCPLCRLTVPRPSALTNLRPAATRRTRVLAHPYIRGRSGA
jgi:hypothetical protein